MTKYSFSIKSFHSKYSVQTVEMWRKSKEQAIGQKEIHSFENHVYFLKYIMPKKYKIDLALMGDKVVGMVAYSNTEIGQLYVHIDYQGKGIGKALLHKAKLQSTGKLTLYTFEVNEHAQRFYEKNGFKIIGRGHENEENLPDIQYQWISE